jgi:hypothetical protein
MTKTLEGRCGKCGREKSELLNQLRRIIELNTDPLNGTVDYDGVAEAVILLVGKFNN